MKYVRPLYRELAKANPALARETFLQNRKSLHSIAEKMVERDLKAIL